MWVEWQKSNKIKTKDRPTIQYLPSIKLDLKKKKKETKQNTCRIWLHFSSELHSLLEKTKDNEKSKETKNKREK